MSPATSQQGGNMRLLASPLRYPGGKGALYSRLRRLIRESELSGCTYVEPYAGGAGAGLGLLVTGQVERVVINDLDPAIHAFWSALVADPEGLAAKIEAAELSVPEWRAQREIYLDKESSDLAARGFATFYLNRTNHSGVLNAGPIGGLEQTGTYKIDARFNRSELIERIRVLGLYTDKIEASALDGVELIKKYSRRKNVFIYADPPYFEKAGSLYLNAFSAENHERLAVALNRIAERNWLLTYDDVPRVHDLYAQRRRRNFELNYSAHRVTEATEIAVLSDGVTEVAGDWTAIPEMERNPEQGLGDDHRSRR
jgi:DNA adenine methylase